MWIHDCYKNESDNSMYCPVCGASASVRADRREREKIMKEGKLTEWNDNGVIHRFWTLGNKRCSDLRSTWYLPPEPTRK